MVRGEERTGAARLKRKMKSDLSDHSDPGKGVEMRMAKLKASDIHCSHLSIYTYPCYILSFVICPFFSYCDID